MRPSHPHSGYGGGGGPAPPPYMGGGGRAALPMHRVGGNHHNFKYYPSLSGSETDVSTSTENLTQEERYVLRNMERQEPQGEETQHSGFHHHHHHPAYHLPPPYTDRIIAQQIASNNARREALRLDAMLAASRQGTPMGHPVGGLRSEDLYSMRLSASRHSMPPHSSSSIVTNPSSLTYQVLSGPVSQPEQQPQQQQQQSLSRLAPSVYSHPSVTDPLLKSPPQSFYQDPAVLLPRKGFSVSSSGAYFDTTATGSAPANSRDASDLQVQNDIIAQLTREMRLNGGHLSGGSDVESSTGSTSTLNNPAATADKIAALALQARLTSVESPPVGVGSAVSSGSSSIPVPISKLGKTGGVEPQQRKSPIKQQQLVSQSSSGVSSMVSLPAHSAAGSMSTDHSVLFTNADMYSKQQQETQQKLLKSQQQLQPKQDQLQLQQQQYQQQQQHNVGQQPQQQAVNGSKPDSLPLLFSSQPELVGANGNHANSSNQSNNNWRNSRSTTNPDSSPAGSPEYSADMLESIISENRELKAEAEGLKRKIARVETLEREMMKIHEAYSALREHSDKRELLEKSARAKLQAEVLNLQEINREIRERHDSVMAQIMSGDTGNIPGLDTILRGEIMRKDALINQLHNQNKELMAAKERQDIETAAQRETLQEQRTHIDVLDAALSNAQNTVLRLEEEVRQKEAYADRVKQMTKSLEQLQAASEKREAMEKKLRAKLEEEVRELREEGGGSRSDATNHHQDTELLLRKLSQAEEKIIRLESERTQWEQRYLEESAMRQVAIDAASIPKDAKIAVLEKSSAESEKRIAEARSDKMRQMAELQQLQRKVIDLELKLKALESTLAEKNAMVKVLQKRAFEKPTDTENILSIPIHDSLSSASPHHIKQLSTSHLGSPSHLSHPHHHHAPQLSTPIPLSSPRHHIDFYDGISSAMASTARGPLGRLGQVGRVRSGSPAHSQRSATPSDILRSATPTNGRSGRRDSAPGEAAAPTSPTGKTLINTSELYTTGMSVYTSGTLPKMSFAPMKEEASRTLPSKGLSSFVDSIRETFPEMSMSTTTATTTTTNSMEGAERKISDTSVRSENETTMSFMDDTVNSSILNKDSLLLALKQEKEKRPENFWRV